MDPSGDHWNHRYRYESTIPLTANLGLTGMRVRARSTGANGATNACTTFTTGESEDCQINILPVSDNFTCATALPIGCFGVLNGYITGANSLPSTACAFNGAAATGGTNWFAYTAASNEDVTFSVCNPAYDVRLQAFKATASPDCNNLVCVGGADDSPGCAPGADLKVKANAGEVIYLAVKGVTNASGLYTISTVCDAQCSPSVANDMCAGATDLNPLPYVGFGTPITDDNTCAYVDGPTGNSGAEPVQGLWYTFNSGVNSKLRMTLTAGTASNLKWALHSGLCDGLDAFSEVANGNASGLTILNVTPATDYRLVVFNTGGPGVQGTFTLNVEKPGINDASISAVLSALQALHLRHPVPTCGEAEEPG
ncbi:MAG: GEVED domain-containing protein [Dermatophilaceae bacterium]